MSVRVNGRQLRQAAVVAGPCCHDGRFEQASIAKSVRPTEASNPDGMGIEHIVDVEEENFVETHAGAVRDPGTLLCELGQYLRVLVDEALKRFALTCARVLPLGGSLLTPWSLRRRNESSLSGGAWSGDSQKVARRAGTALGGVAESQRVEYVPGADRSPFNIQRYQSLSLRASSSRTSCSTISHREALRLASCPHLEG
jgi:hypothetical protein